MTLPINSYHDVTVIINGKEYNLFNSTYGLNLECCRVGGWQLWYKSPLAERNEEQIGGEYNGDHFQIKFGDTIVFDNRAK